jgi:hypothetical protein
MASPESPFKKLKLPEEEPLENPRLDWEEEDIELENRKPDLSEIEDDESGL